MFQDKNYNLVPFFGIFIATIAIFWYYISKLDAGYIYIGIYTVPLVSLFALSLFIKDETKKTIFDKLKIPFETSTESGAFMFVLGWLVYTIVFLAFSNSNFSITSLMIPLAANKINIVIQQTAAQVEIASSLGAQLFNTVFIASFIEEFAFRFVLVFLGFVLGKFIYEGVTHKKSPFIVNLIFAIISSGITFAALHYLNSTYNTWQMYVAATVFSMLMSISIYFAGLFLSFTIGFHQANNFFWFAQTYGWKSTLQALWSWQGAVMMGFWVLMIVILLNAGKKDIHKMFVQLFKDLKRGYKA
jgi:hypothetical protein